MLIGQLETLVWKQGESAHWDRLKIATKAWARTSRHPPDHTTGILASFASTQPFASLSTHRKRHNRFHPGRSRGRSFARRSLTSESEFKVPSPALSGTLSHARRTGEGKFCNDSPQRQEQIRVQKPSWCLTPAASGPGIAEAADSRDYGPKRDRTNKHAGSEIS